MSIRYLLNSLATSAVLRMGRSASSLSIRVLTFHAPTMSGTFLIFLLFRPLGWDSPSTAASRPEGEVKFVRFTFSKNPSHSTEQAVGICLVTLAAAEMPSTPIPGNKRQITPGPTVCRFVTFSCQCNPHLLKSPRPHRHS